MVDLDIICISYTVLPDSKQHHWAGTKTLFNNRQKLHFCRPTTSRHLSGEVKTRTYLTLMESLQVLKSFDPDGVVLPLPGFREEIAIRSPLQLSTPPQPAGENPSLLCPKDVSEVFVREGKYSTDVNG